MTNNTHKRVLRSFIIVFIVLVIASVANWWIAATPISGQTTVFVETPPFAVANRALADYFSCLFVEYVKDDLLVEEVLTENDVFLRPQEKPTVKVTPSTHGETSFDLTMVGLESNNLLAVIDGLVNRVEKKLRKEARRTLVKLIEGREHELNILERKLQFEKSMGRQSDHFRRRCEDLGAELQHLRHLFGQQFTLLHTTEPFISVKMSNEWTNKDIIGLLTALALLLTLAEFLLHDVTRRRSQNLIESTSGLPVIASIPNLETSLPMKYKPMGPAAEAFRALRTELHCRQCKRIVFVSWSQGEGTSTVVANTALSFAESGSNVLLIDGNLRKPALNEIFRISNDVGLSDVLIDTEPQAVIWDAPDESLKLLAAGPRPPDPAALLAGKRLEMLVKALDEITADVVIIDVPPLAVCADVLFFAQAADAVVFLARPGAETPERVLAAIRQLRRHGVPLVGMLFNDVEIATAARMNYAHQYE